MSRVVELLALLLIPAEAIRSTHAPAARCRRPRSLAQLHEAGDAEFEWPEELLGPWELTTTLPGVGNRIWVELNDDRECECSSAFGTGSSWQAARRHGNWQLGFVILDKLKRPITFEGEVRNDDGVRRLSTSGMIFGPPRNAAAKVAAGFPRGVEMGKFDGYHLD